jgi:hypothetical protein
MLLLRLLLLACPGLEAFQGDAGGVFLRVMDVVTAVPVASWNGMAADLYGT